MRGAKRTVAVAVLSILSLSFSGSLAAACPVDDECEAVGPVGPVGPDGFGNPVELRSDAFLNPDTSRWTYVDGSTSETYNSGWQTPVTIETVWERTVYVIEHLFDHINRYEIYERDDGAPRG
jgi:hypothetical protein